MNAYLKFNQLAAQVTKEVIAELEKGEAIWQKPWSSFGLPKNYFSGRPYEGFNAFYLQHLTRKHSYQAPYFLTFKQARELGGHVRKGQKGIPILFWNVYKPKAEDNAGKQQAEDRPELRARRLVPFLWTVFNIDQVEGVDYRLPAVTDRPEQRVIASCQQVVEGFPPPLPQIRHGGSEAWYAPALDTVQVPELRRFTTPEAYHATLFHELIHATGHPARLNRFSAEEKDSSIPGGIERYSMEELVAEMGASFLCAFTGVGEKVFQNSVAYLQGWISRLRHDKTMLLYAAARAYRAASYILGQKVEEAAPPAGKVTA